MGKTFDSASIYYVYILKHPDTLQPFYIGKGKGNRMYRHERDARNHNLPNKTNGYLYRKLKDILANGKRPVYEIVQDCMSEQAAFSLEVAVIDDIGLNNLCNCVLFSPNSQTKSRGKLGYRMTPEELVEHKKRHNTPEYKLMIGLDSYRKAGRPKATLDDYKEYRRQKDLDSNLKLLTAVVDKIRRELERRELQKHKRKRDTTTKFPRDEQGREYRLCPSCGKRIYATARTTLLKAERIKSGCRECAAPIVSAWQRNYIASMTDKQRKARKAKLVASRDSLTPEQRKINKQKSIAGIEAKLAVRYDEHLEKTLEGMKKIKPSPTKQ